MDQDKYISLVYKQLQGQLTIIEQNLLDSWLKEAAINRTIAQKIKDDWALSEGYAPPIDYDLAKEFQALQTRIKEDTKVPKAVATIVPMKKNRSWLSWFIKKAINP